MLYLIHRRGGRDVDPPQVGEGSKNGTCVRDAQVVHLRLHSWRGASSEDMGHHWQSERGDRKRARGLEAQALAQPPTPPQAQYPKAAITFVEVDVRVGGRGRCKKARSLGGP